MGNCDSKSPPKATLPKERKLLTFGKDPNLKMSDYMCSKKKGEVVVKEDMKGQQFVMEESEVRGGREGMGGREPGGEKRTTSISSLIRRSERKSIPANREPSWNRFARPLLLLVLIFLRTRSSYY